MEEQHLSEIKQHSDRQDGRFDRRKISSISYDLKSILRPIDISLKQFRDHPREQGNVQRALKGVLNVPTLMPLSDQDRDSVDRWGENLIESCAIIDGIKKSLQSENADYANEEFKNYSEAIHDDLIEIADSFKENLKHPENLSDFSDLYDPFDHGLDHPEQVREKSRTWRNINSHLNAIGLLTRLDQRDGKQHTTRPPAPPTRNSGVSRCLPDRQAVFPELE